jgi:CheY-like chemotaxis protein
MQYRVVLVEDNPSDVDVVKMAIQKAGLNVKLQVLTDGAAAMDYVHSLAKPHGAMLPHLMILDLSLPWATGDEVLRECRANPKSAEVPVILTSSAIGHPAYMNRMQAYGANRVFLKPLEMESFLQIGGIIRELLESDHPSSDSGGTAPPRHSRSRTQRKGPSSDSQQKLSGKAAARHRKF